MLNITPDSKWSSPDENLFYWSLDPSTVSLQRHCNSSKKLTNSVAASTSHMQGNISNMYFYTCCTATNYRWKQNYFWCPPCLYFIADSILVPLFLKLWKQLKITSDYLRFTNVFPVKAQFHRMPTNINIISNALWRISLE